MTYKSNTQSQQAHLLLHDRSNSMQWTKALYYPLAKEVYHAVLQGRSMMPHGKPLTARQICGKPFWDSLGDGQRRFAGRFISAAVRLGMFGLEQGQHNTANHWTYTVT
jgi:hypothetical protein